MAAPRKMIVGNWKMNKTMSSAGSDFATFSNRIFPQLTQVDAAISAPFLYLPALSSLRSPVGVFAQSCHWAQGGAFTGEISVPMLAEIGVTGSLVGHSERRQMCGESNQSAGQRMATLLRSGLQAIYCVGETLQERDSNRVFDVIRNQLVEGFAAGGVRNSSDVVGADGMRPLLSIAYEPVWAIGTGRAATVKQAAEVHAFIRLVLTEIVGFENAEKIRILYGGSVTLENAATFLTAENVDGALVGGASLDPETFAKLVHLCATL